MLHGARLGREFFGLLMEMDGGAAEEVATAGCPRPDCGGPLHRADYARKPRGGLWATAGEALCRRFSLCCGWCRRRCLPPSVRFLGRRVYFEAVVFLACVWVLCGGDIADTGVPARTVGRWLGWWTSLLPTLPVWIELRARFAPPPPDASALPRSLVERVSQELGPLGGEEAIEKVARLLAPLTTTSCPGASRFLRAG